MRAMNKRKRRGRPRFTTYESPIADRRIELGLSQTELAKRLGFKGHSRVANTEAGVARPHVRDLRKWMKALKWDAETLLKALGI